MVSFVPVKANLHKLNHKEHFATNHLPASLLTLLLLTSVPSSNLSAQESPDPLRAALARRIDDAKIGTGVAVGLLTPEGRLFAAYGRARAEGTAVTADTIFEIGSVTKVFTSFLLADMVERGEVKLSDPVQKYLPASVKVPSRRGKQILLVDLATHSSGLPRDSVPYNEETRRHRVDQCGTGRGRQRSGRPRAQSGATRLTHASLTTDGCG